MVKGDPLHVFYPLCRNYNSQAQSSPLPRLQAAAQNIGWNYEKLQVFVGTSAICQIASEGGDQAIAFWVPPNPISAGIVKVELVPAPDAKSPAKGATKQLLFGYCTDSSPSSPSRVCPRRWTRCGEHSRWQSALSHYAPRSSWKRVHAVRGHAAPIEGLGAMAREDSSSTGCCGSWVW
jgi:hypothetical protein